MGSTIKDSAALQAVLPMSIMKGIERNVAKYLRGWLGFPRRCFKQQKEQVATSVWQRSSLSCLMIHAFGRIFQASDIP